MRITKKEHNAIKNVIIFYDPAAKIYLFGSRADDQKKGGDIDLLILSEVISEKDRRNIKLEILDRIGEQKLDLVIAKDLNKPFTRIAYNNGIPL